MIEQVFRIVRCWLRRSSLYGRHYPYELCSRPLRYVTLRYAHNMIRHYASRTL